MTRNKGIDMIPIWLGEYFLDIEAFSISYFVLKDFY